MSEHKPLRPQKGPQEKFLKSNADIAFYGGSAGGGKSYALLLEPLYHLHNPNFGAVCFRRTIPQIKNEGGLFDESGQIYPLLRAEPNMSELFWRFPSGAVVSFAHLEHEKNIYDWQGAQIPLLMFDEITHFTKKQFFYMLSRNRSTCGIRPYIRATTNPDKKSWVRQFIDWWIGPDGFPIPERSGVIRWFIVKDDKVIWAETKEGFPEGSTPKSFTFIAAKLSDNKILMEKDPGYLANLNALSRVERAKLLDGNWDAEEKPGELFQKQWFKFVKVPPAKITKMVRYWDRAASESETADYTVGTKLGQLDNNQFIILDMVRFRGSPLRVEEMIKNMAIQDGVKCIVGIEEDPGQAGKVESSYLSRQLVGFNVRIQRATKDKITRALPFSAQCEAGNVLMVESKWNDDMISELESFPEGNNDDIVDTLSGGFAMLLGTKTGTFTSAMASSNRKENENW
jgi:predicted phage terminase large subunit-like protein